MALVVLLHERGRTTVPVGEEDIQSNLEETRDFSSLPQQTFSQHHVMSYSCSLAFVYPSCSSHRMLEGIFNASRAYDVPLGHRVSQLGPFL